MIGEGPYIPHFFGEEVTEKYRQSLGWLTAAVHHSIPWPNEDALISYDGEDYFLRGLRLDSERPNDACITIRLPADRDINSALKRVYVFTSILGWYQKGFVDVVGHISGSRPTLYSAGKQPFAITRCAGNNSFNCNFMPVIRSEATRKALAFWREGLRLEQIHPGYSFLSFYKVIESQFKKGTDRAAWIENALLTLGGKAQERVRTLQEESVDVNKHIYESGRCAVAHASLDSDQIDPDIPEDRVRIAKDLVVIKNLAEKFIREQLRVPDYLDVSNGRDALLGSYEFIKEDHLRILHEGGSVLRKKLGLNGLKVSINHWPNKPCPEFQGLSLSVLSAHEGLVEISAANEDNSLSLIFQFSFTARKAVPDIQNSAAIPVENGGRAAVAVAFLEYQKAILGNGIIELTFPNEQKVVCEIVIPVNIDIGATFRAIDQRIETITNSLIKGDGSNLSKDAG